MEFNALVPELTLSNVEKSLEFYQLLGFRVEYHRLKRGFVFLSRERAQLMLEQFQPRGWNVAELKRPFGRGINFQIQVSNIEPLLEALNTVNHPLYRLKQERWRRVGAEEVAEVEFLVQDPDGYLLRFSQYLGKRPFGEPHAQS
ncbi:MAG: aldoketomutase [Meiothermus sp.]